MYEVRCGHNHVYRLINGVYHGPEKLKGSLRGNSIYSLGNLKELHGDLDFTPNLKDLGSLKKVKGNVHLCRSKITSLGSLTSVTGDLNIAMTEIKSIFPLYHVGRNLTLYGSPVTDFRSLKFVKGQIFIIPYKGMSRSRFRKSLKRVTEEIELDQAPLCLTNEHYAECFKQILKERLKNGT